ncbi:MAG: hypothetical protein C0508_04690 [Cyanobacteria bacterium PR.023]|nr:hypothetical protein [Cyanobacteria bacterium PR.023]
MLILLAFVGPKTKQFAQEAHLDSLLLDYNSLMELLIDLHNAFQQPNSRLYSVSDAIYRR